MSNSIIDLKNKLQQIQTNINQLKQESLAIASQLQVKIEQESFLKTQKAIDEQDIKELLIVSLKDNGDFLNQLQKRFWSNYLKSVNKLVSINGFFEESKEISFNLKLINSKFNKNQIEKLLPVLEPIFENLALIKIHKDFYGRYKVITLLDKKSGENGSLSIIKDDNNNYLLYRENRMNPEVLIKSSKLSDILMVASKNFYYFG